jgi:WD40 repeat protein
MVLVGARGELVNSHTGRLVRTFPGLPAGVTACGGVCFAASPGLTWLSYLDPTSATPRIVELSGQTGRRVAAVTVPRLDAQAVAPDGRVAVAYVDGDRLYAELIDPRSGQILRLQSAQSSDGCAATTPSFTADGRLMAIVDGCIHLTVWDLGRGRIVRTILLHNRSNGSGAVLSPDGRYVLATVLGGGFVRVDIRSGQVAEVPGAEAEGHLVAVSPNGRFYAIGREDATVDVYDAHTLRLVRHHALVSSVQAMAFSPDSQELAIEDTDNVVRVWDTCAICENPQRLAAMATKESVRQLTPAERRTFAVS